MSASLYRSEKRKANGFFDYNGFAHFLCRQSEYKIRPAHKLSKPSNGTTEATSFHKLFLLQTLHGF